MDRRTFVQTGVAAALGVGTAATAGCSNLPLVGSGGGAYTNWLHEPGEVTDRDHYSVNVIRPETVVGNEDAFDDSYVDGVEGAYDDMLDPTGLDTDEAREIVNTNVGTVFLGSFQVDDVVADLEDEDFDDDDEVGGFTIYTTDDEGRAWAVSSGALVGTFSRNGEAAPDVAETLIGVSNGEEDRYAEESDAMGVLTGTLSNGFQRFTQTYEASDQDAPESGRFEDSVGLGASLALSGDTVDLEYVVAYEDADDVDQGDLEDWVDGQDEGTFDDVENVSYNTSGQAAIVTGQMDADDLTTSF